MSAPLVLTRPRRASVGTSQAVHPRPQPAAAVPPTDDADRIEATAKSLAIACLEIFSGIRRSESIARWVDADLLTRIDRRAQLRAEIAPATPMREHTAARTLQAGHARVCRVHAGVAEVTVMVRTATRVRAVAIRLELLTNRWTMTAMQTM